MFHPYPSCAIHHRLVFAGVAYSKLSRDDEAEKVYLKAADLFPKQQLAFQGLEKLYKETDNSEKLVQLLQRQVITAVER